MWNKTWFVKDETHRTMLRSYAMELLISKIYDTNKNQSGPELFLSMLNVLNLAVQRKLAENWRNITFNDYFVSRTFPDPKRPLCIYDPCFPESDVVSDFEAWDDLADRARRTISLMQSDISVAQIFPIQ
eukprot:Phypoly_transcript_20147.p1 GENE.Phypoly_transcript_20147~~Phypoly_transcript_20147.p1  ORF type:complete len:129 (+),score=8.55 Phypoly_transcript_20147:203-589(+)